MNSFLDLTGLAKSLRVWLILALALASGAAMAQPSDLTASGNSPTSITMNWTSHGEDYTISYHCDCGGDEVYVGSTTGSSFTIGGLKPGTSYTVYVNYGNGRYFLRGYATTGARRAAVSRSSDSAPAPEPLPPKPRPITCASLPASMVVSGYGEWTQCQRVSGAAVGNAGLIAQGLIDAVDIWGYVSSEVRVCFRQPGMLYFLDAATSPRSLSELPPTQSAGQTCGMIKRPGTVALLPGAPPEPERECRVSLTGNLRVRARPSMKAETIGFLRRGVGLPLISRTRDWLEIDYMGAAGFIGAAYARENGDCA